MKIKQTFTLVLLTGLIIAGLWFRQSKSIVPAPAASFTSISGKKIELAQLQGNVVIVTFWATDCPSCIKEIPHLVELYQQFHPQGLEIIAIAMYYDPPSHVVAMTKAKQLPYHVTLDLKAKHAKAFGQVQLTPNTFLISPAGYIVHQITGEFDMNDIKHRIEQLLQG